MWSFRCGKEPLNYFFEPMKKIENITMLRTTGEQFYQVGANLLDAKGNVTKVSVTNIKVVGGTVTISFSDKKEFVFVGLPFIFVRK